MKIIMLGAPGAGKGTQAAKIAAKYQIPHISTGDIFRANLKAGTELGKKAKEYMDQGLLVPDELTCDLVTDRVSKDDCANGYILDGFPRTIMSGRRACVTCGATYHIEHIPPKVEGICDRCGGELILRSDDKPETVQKRLDVYHAQTQPLIDFYESKKKLVTVDGTKDMEDVFADITAVLEG